MDSNSKPPQAQRILAILQERGDQGVTNVELNRRVCFRYGARLLELRKQGYIIETIRVKEAVFRYVLRGKRNPYKNVVLRPKPKAKPALKPRQLSLV